jgi:hypothetical protein
VPKNVGRRKGKKGRVMKERRRKMKGRGDERNEQL